MLTRAEAIRLINNNQDLRKISGAGGSVYLGATANTGLALTSFFVRENTTITVATGVDSTGAAFSFLTPLGISGITLIQGDFFTIDNGFRITALTITGGSVIGYM